jgi:acetolactate synthase-1/2/3 large subunit
MTVKYSDVLIDQLVSLGYTHCFFVGGGNVMHLLESARTRMTCIAVVNEVSAGIAAEYFNVAMRGKGVRALAVVTAGPGLTNIVTAIAASWLESRELLVIGGQARTEFLANGEVRQVGHQEVDGAAITAPITKLSKTVTSPLSFEELREITDISRHDRKGPVFLELCLDVSAQYVEEPFRPTVLKETFISRTPSFDDIVAEWNRSERPLFLVGHGLSYETFQEQLDKLRTLNIPIATSWNAADYISFDDPLYAGRPNIYGMRWANAAIQQSDLVIAVGARLGLQQTGFNWQGFAPLAKIIHIDIDSGELEKINPGPRLKVLANANQVFPEIVNKLLESPKRDSSEWLGFIQLLKSKLPTNEEANNTFEKTVNPYQLISELSDILPAECAVVPCSSGGTYTVAMQAFRQKAGQLLTNNKGLASMGYGLAGAIGTALARPEETVVLLEGDGGFAQNLGEIGTVANHGLNIKMVVFENGGYASIRISQKAYFDGNYLGCDTSTGLQLPKWKELFSSFGVETVDVFGSLLNHEKALSLLANKGPAAIIVHLDKDQQFYPKLTSSIAKTGVMQSNPLHLMHPPIDPELTESVFRYLPEELRSS